jgi:L-methionine (R)-S-oxide reductase
VKEIAALGWSGEEAPKHPRFPVGQGLCGAAAQAGATVLVGDVTQDPRYLTTFSSTRSEMIVPIMQRVTRRPIGLIDVESERVNAFGKEDRDLLESWAEVLVALWD